MAHRVDNIIKCIYLMFNVLNSIWYGNDRNVGILTALNCNHFKSWILLFCFLGHEIFVYLYVKNLSWFCGHIPIRPKWWKIKARDYLSTLVSKMAWYIYYIRDNFEFDGIYMSYRLNFKFKHFLVDAIPCIIFIFTSLCSKKYMYENTVIFRNLWNCVRDSLKYIIYRHIKMQHKDIRQQGKVIYVFDFLH